MPGRAPALAFIRAIGVNTGLAKHPRDDPTTNGDHAAHVFGHMSRLCFDNLDTVIVDWQSPVNFNIGTALIVVV